MSLGAFWHSTVDMLLFAAGKLFITRSCVATNLTITGCFPLNEVTELQGEMSPTALGDNKESQEPGSGTRSKLITGTGCFCATDLCDPETPSDWNEPNENVQNKNELKEELESENLTRNASNTGAVRQSSVTHGSVVLGLPVLCATQQVRAQFH